jgi:SAM-dependent methyltransferase
MAVEKHPPVCDYEGSDYQTRFWEKGGREYEDGCEAIALKRLLPPKGKLLLELGAGAGRNTPRYQGFDRIVLLDYSRTQLKQAQERLGRSDRYVYVASDIYKLPFAPEVFDAATMIRTLHHMADAPAALAQLRSVLQPGAAFILEYANKHNLKSILRFMFHRQAWNPNSIEPVEFAPLNFDFHPRAVRGWLNSLDFHIEKILTVSHLRIGLLKRTLPTRLLVGLDALLQWTGAIAQVSPSVFLRARLPGHPPEMPNGALFKCPECGHAPLTEKADRLSCPVCKREWDIVDGIYDFRGNNP